MIPSFPNFKPIELADKEEIESFYKLQREFLSDLSFLNLWLWGQDEKNKVAKLNGNLVFLLSDYETHLFKLSFLGEERVVETANTLLDFALEKKLEEKLYYLSESVVKNLPAEEFLINRDEDNSDYVLSIKTVSDFKSSGLKSQFRSKNSFLKTYPEAEFLVQSSSEVDRVDDLLDIFEVWASNKGEKAGNLLNEKQALKYLVDNFFEFDLILSKVLIKGDLVAFSVDEILSDDFVLSHFAKADFRLKGIYEFLNSQTATFLHKSGAKYWNWEQDLGIEGLRKNKEKYRPVKKNNKFTVEKRCKDCLFL